jgi:hypothetical protein
VRIRPALLAASAVVLLAVPLGGWLLLRPVDPAGGTLPAPITVPQGTTPPAAPTQPPSGPPQPPVTLVPVPTDVVPPPPVPDNDDDDDDDGPDDDDPGDDDD